MLISTPGHRGMRAAGKERGISLVELMVGIAVGMIVVAGATVMLVNQVNEHRRLMLETQVQQDLRAASDLILRELRRAGYRGRVQDGIWSPAAPAAVPAVDTPYAVTNPIVATAGAAQVEYRYNKTPAPLNPALPAVLGVFNQANEQFGFRRNGGVLNFQLGNGNWQPLTDPSTLTVTAFTVDLVVQSIPLGDYCEQPCPTGAAMCPPSQQVLNFTVSLTGTATHDPAVVRTMNVSTRVRNDRIVGVCPLPT